jgi:hypothetical protein
LLRAHGSRICNKKTALSQTIQFYLARLKGGSDGIEEKARDNVNFAVSFRQVSVWLNGQEQDMIPMSGRQATWGTRTPL